MLRYLAFLLVVLLPSCSSILGHATQRVTFLTPGAHDSVCHIDNGEVMYRAFPPQTITIAKRDYDLVVRCVADGNREKTVVIKPEPQSVALANFSNGFVPGMYIDQETGALFGLPDTITVDFTDMPAGEMPKPNYDQHIEDNPHLFGMEEFRPSKPALMSDKNKPAYEIQKREHPGQISGFGSAIPSSSSNTDGSGAASEGSGESSSSADDLSRSMNPQLYDKRSSSGESQSGAFIGGTSPDGPTLISPAGQQ